jgi:hypothetical protein
MRIRGTDSLIADRQISAVADSPSSEGEEERCLNTCGVAQGHVRRELVAGFGIPV